MSSILSARAAAAWNGCNQQAKAGGFARFCLLEKGEWRVALIRLAGVIKESVVDGPGIRFVVFTQGCPHRCPGCQNPDTHDPCGGYDSDTRRLAGAFSRNPLLKGLTLSGGEPFEQAGACADLAARIHALGRDVVAYTGYTLERLLAGANEENQWLSLLRQVDVLVDGPFQISRKTMSLLFRGSANQRALDIPASMKRGFPVEAAGWKKD